jgi:hypothetical protein
MVDELGRIWKGIAMVLSKLLSCHLPGGTEETNGKLESV